jgi:hypothetical protein
MVSFRLMGGDDGGYWVTSHGNERILYKVTTKTILDFK